MWKTKSHRPGETGQMSPRLQHIHLCLSVLTDGPDLARYVFKFVFKFGVSKGNICRSAVVSQPELWRWRDGIVKKDCFDADAVSEVFLSTYGTHTQVKSQRNSPLSERLEENQNVLWSDSITISVCGSRPGLWKCLCWGFFITGVFFFHAVNVFSTVPYVNNIYSMFHANVYVFLRCCSFLKLYIWGHFLGP